MRIATYNIKCDTCPRFFKLEVGDDSFNGQVGDWATAGVERLGWALTPGRIRCWMCKGQA